MSCSWITAGENLRLLSATSAMGLDGYQYTFDVERAAGRPLAFTVKDAARNTLGTGTLEYSDEPKAFYDVNRISANY
jgi:hypothetical protein